ncbi:hypothetical protein I3843_07G224100 [Carya illinoinensis]|nr:hypothetical protein I3843_07G224100 [Carya illinoinensis]
MASSDTELEEQLLQAGNKLVDPPSSVDELLSLLDHVENCLLRVEQSPTKSMQNALSPSLKALVGDQLFRHSDVDVKVAVASCISEITRITAPDAPYDDDQMKEIFQLIVSSFENLSDNSSRSYTKRTSILETVAKVRSCVVMLDLECDALILEMFQNFLKAIREHHPDNVFSSMETIMTLVLEESEDIALELLTPILDSVKKDNEEVLPVARKLAERVLESCATKVKPYLIQAVKTLGISFDDYSEVVASICQETSGTVEQNEVHAISKDMADESKSGKASVDERGTEDKEKSTAVVSSEQVDLAIQQSPKSVMSNGVAQTGEDDSLQLLNSENKQEHGHLSDQSKNISTSSNARPNNLETEKLPEPKSNSKDASSSPPVEPSVESAGSLKNEKVAGIKISSPKALDNESGNVAALSPRGSLPDESNSKKAGGRPKKRESSIKEAMPSSHDISKKVSEGTGDLEPKSNRRSGKKVPSEISNENKTPTVVDASSKEISDPEAKPLRQPAKKVDGSIKIEGSSSKQPEDKKKRGRGKAISEKDETKSSTKERWMLYPKRVEVLPPANPKVPLQNLVVNPVKAVKLMASPKMPSPRLRANQRMSVVGNLRIICLELAVVNQLMLLLNRLGSPRKMILSHPRLGNSKMIIPAHLELPPSPSKALQRLESPSRTYSRVLLFPRARTPKVVASLVPMVLAR